VCLDVSQLAAHTPVTCLLQLVSLESVTDCEQRGVSHENSSHKR
jgi:hypothetical protein